MGLPLMTALVLDLASKRHTHTPGVYVPQGGGSGGGVSSIGCE